MVCGYEGIVGHIGHLFLVFSWQQRGSLSANSSRWVTVIGKMLTDQRMWIDRSSPLTPIPPPTITPPGLLPPSHQTSRDGTDSGRAVSRETDEAPKTAAGGQTTGRRRMAESPSNEGRGMEAAVPPGEAEESRGRRTDQPKRTTQDLCVSLERQDRSLDLAHNEQIWTSRTADVVYDSSGLKGTPDPGPSSLGRPA
ncbi:hypothetical protein SODALDRAFT_354169 [Sodiomyces alkalinus F11]|uniref:Uncharacterized protein n=1 Tax=Sodiomyces alkalinus (strain CBS 110278 / VKM F-3762 / F11) TaxID=1314773 RepID=A0A3N2Q5K1_SODAK|nr:hypothetical protein SODALDRAFT_354169 [Sodiomyces alkalinus F11]ROT42051.1 hypothetical protein SODALDRAFT_354169 [Sodiomyces alkalinus F11]